MGGEAEEVIWDQIFRNHIDIYLFIFVCTRDALCF